MEYTNAAAAAYDPNDLIVVSWNPGSEIFSVSARRSADEKWDTWEGQPEELPELLSIARDLVTGS